MPNYEYECEKCQKTIEIMQSIKEDTIKECPECHSKEFKRIISKNGSFLLMGSGWYKTGGY